MRLKYIGFAAAILLVSCKKYLEVKSRSGYVTPNTLESLQALLDDSRTMNGNVNSYAVASADDYFLVNDNFNSLSKASRDVYTWENFIYQFDNDWARGYQPVYSANLVLDQLKTIPKNAGNEAQWNRIQAAALFYRSHQFLSLVWTYSKAYTASTAATDLGIVLRTTSDPYVPSKRATVADSYMQIISDLQASLKGLPGIAEHSMRPSRSAAYALLARTYLSMAKYDSALLYADSTLQLRPQLMDFNDPQQVTTGSSVPFKRFNSETIFYAQLPSIQECISSFYAMADSLLYSDYADNDLRKSAYFIPSGNYYNFKAGYSEDNYGWFGGIATDEIYLIRSECRVQTGDIAGAMNDLNTLLRSRYISGTFTDITAAGREEALQIIYRERRKELPMRGMRWIDVKRLNAAGEQIILHRMVNGQSVSLPPNDNRYALPLPDDIIRTTGMPQNAQ